MTGARALVGKRITRRGKNCTANGVEMSVETVSEH
jgi:hypothetical protein